MHLPDMIREELHTPLCGAYDVIVVGGGVAGCAAALCAARAGQKTLLLEKMTMLGGLGTAGHVVLYLPLCDGYGRQVCGGVSEELMRLSVRYAYGDDLHGWQENGRRLETRFNGPAFALALEELLLEAGVELLYDTRFAGSILRDDGCEAILVENKSGRQSFACGAVVDATGDAEVFARAGLTCPARENSLAIWCYCTRGGEGHLLKRGGAAEYGLHLLTLGNIDTKARHHVVQEPYFGDSAAGVNRFVQHGHRRLLDLLKADKDLVLASLPSMPQLRMVRRIEGLYVLGEGDLGRHFEDCVGATGDWRRPAPVYEIPFRALYTKGLSNVLAAGRCIAADGDAWEVTRVIPPAAVTGQAAGVAAAMIAAEGVAARDLSVPRLREALSAAGVLLDINRAPNQTREDV